jgi:hypothetical protein
MRLRYGSVDARSSERVLDCGAGVRLQGFYTAPATGTSPRGLVILFHGWEGCHRSTYVVSAAAYLGAVGYAVFRLNFRDHGRTHHLNPEIFHCCRLDEVVGAVGEVAREFPTRPLALVGFSLGGNFALRVATRGPAVGLRLAHVIAISPVIDPAGSLAALENGSWHYERHFVRKWRRSLRRKQRAFPGLYDFSEWIRLTTLREQTTHLIARHTGFRSIEDYLDGYSVAGSRLGGLRVAATILAAEDDPIIPVGGLRRLRPSRTTGLEIHRYGGHCGFLESFGGPSWIDRRVVAILDSRAGGVRG